MRKCFTVCVSYTIFFYWKIRSHWKCAAHSAYTRIAWSAKCVRTISFKMVGQISKYKHTKYMYNTLYKTFAVWFIWKISFYFAFVINFYVFPAFSWSLYFFDFFQIWFCLSREAVLAIGNWQAILLNHYLIASRFFFALCLHLKIVFFGKHFATLSFYDNMYVYICIWTRNILEHFALFTINWVLSVHSLEILVINWDALSN